MQGPNEKIKQGGQEKFIYPVSCMKSERGDGKLHTMHITTAETGWVKDIQEGIHNAPVLEQHIALGR